MSFDFNNSFNSSNINPMKAQSAYKDGGGMGGGGMYMRQQKKKKSEKDEDLFQHEDEKNDNEIVFDKDIDEKNVPEDTFFNKFVNWFRIKNQ